MGDCTDRGDAAECRRHSGILCRSASLIHNFLFCQCIKYSRKMCYKCVKIFGRNVGATFSANKLCIYIINLNEWHTYVGLTKDFNPVCMVKSVQYN